MEVRPMPTEPRTPADHYREAERLIAATAETPTSAPLLAVAHALLCAAPRRARRRPQPAAGHGGSPQQRWLYGQDGDDDR
jgi:hypothetical protein